MLCRFTGAYTGTTWRMYPGYYPGRLWLEAGVFYLEPGIYIVADGGFRIAGATASVTSVDPGGTTLGGGILLFNTTHPSTTTDPGQIVLQGGGAGVNLLPLDQGTPWDQLVVYQDPEITLDVSIVGGSSTMIDAFSALTAGRTNRLYGTARPILRDGRLAEDGVQETLSRICERSATSTA